MSAYRDSNSDDGHLPLPTKPLVQQQKEVPRKALVTVQPPRREDLQPSYASTMAAYPDDNAVHGWYESMVNTFGGCLGTLGSIPGCICCPNPYKRDKYIFFMFCNECHCLSDRERINPRAGRFKRLFRFLITRMCLSVHMITAHLLPILITTRCRTNLYVRSPS